MVWLVQYRNRRSLQSRRRVANPTPRPCPFEFGTEGAVPSYHCPDLVIVTPAMQFTSSSTATGKPPCRRLLASRKSTIT